MNLDIERLKQIKVFTETKMSADETRILTIFDQILEGLSKNEDKVQSALEHAIEEHNYQMIFEYSINFSFKSNYYVSDIRIIFGNTTVFSLITKSEKRISVDRYTIQRLCELIENYFEGEYIKLIPITDIHLNRTASSQGILDSYSKVYKFDII